MKNLILVGLIFLVACGKKTTTQSATTVINDDLKDYWYLESPAELSGKQLDSAIVVCDLLAQKHENFHRHYLRQEFVFNLSLENCKNEMTKIDIPALLDSYNSNSPLTYLAASSSALDDQEYTQLHGPIAPICQAIRKGQVVANFEQVNENVRNVFSFSDDQFSINQGIKQKNGYYIVNGYKIYHLETSGPFVGLIRSREEFNASCENDKPRYLIQTVVQTPN
jgi:hypothetical protein